jgi:hypothetical protein
MMDEAKATEILKDCIGAGCPPKNNQLHSLGWYLAWDPGDKEATLDGIFSAEELEAIAWWMRNKE